MSENNGSGWRYRCWRCNYEVGIDAALPEKCPGCHAGGWWGHLVTPEFSQNDAKFDGAVVKTTTQKDADPIKTRNRILSQENNAVEQCEAENKGIFETPPARGRGRPRLTVPDDLILELAGQGFSSRQIAADLPGRGFHLSYKSIQRFLKRQKQASFL